MLRRLKNISNNAYLYSVLTKICNVVLGFAYSILFARFMGAELNGNASIILNYVTMLDVVLCMGIYQAYPYYKKNINENDSGFLSRFVSICMGLGILYIIVAFILACFVQSWQAKTIIIMLPLAFYVKIFDYLSLIDNPKRINTINVLLKSTDILFILILFIATKPSLSILLMFLIARQIYYMIGTSLGLKLPLSSMKPTFSKDIITYIKYGFLPMLTILMMTINYKIDTIMLSKYNNVLLSQIGVYGLGVTLAEHVWIIPDALKDILLSELTGGKGAEEVAKVSRFSLIVLLFCIIGIAIVGKPLIHFIYGDQYSDAYPVMLLITTGGFGMVFYKMVYSYNVINGKRFINFLLLLIAAISNIIMNAILIPTFAINGAAIASLISYTICGLCFLIYFNKETGISLKEMIVLSRDDLKLIKSISRNK